MEAPRRSHNYFVSTLVLRFTNNLNRPTLPPVPASYRSRQKFSKENTKMQKRSSLVLMLALLAVSASLLLPSSASAATVGIPITGTFTNSTGAGHFIGTFNIQNFAVRSGKLVAVG